MIPRRRLWPVCTGRCRDSSHHTLLRMTSDRLGARIVLPSETPYQSGFALFWFLRHVSSFFLLKSNCRKKKEHSMMEEGCEQEKFEGTDQNEPPKKKVSCS